LFRALSGRLKFTVRRHKFNKDSLSGGPLESAWAKEARSSGPGVASRTTCHSSASRLCPTTWSSQFENYFFTEMCSGSEAGSHFQLIDFECHSTIGLRVIKKEKKITCGGGVTADFYMHLFEQQNLGGSDWGVIGHHSISPAADAWLCSQAAMEPSGVSPDLVGRRARELHDRHTGGNPGANEWLFSQLPPESGGICGRSTPDLPLGCLQGGQESSGLILDAWLVSLSGRWGGGQGTLQNSQRLPNTFGTSTRCRSSGTTNGSYQVGSVSTGRLMGPARRACRESTR
jgi:hypothetical protein